MPRPAPLLVLTVGLPGAGKTTRAKELAAGGRMLRLTPDEWMAPLFGESDPDGRRDVMEGRLLWVAHEVLRGGGSVVVDFGCWSPQERYAIRVLAESVSAQFRLEYLRLDEAERRRRADRRFEEAPQTTFFMSAADHDRYLAVMQPPSAEELSYAPIPVPPAPFDTWTAWANDRWPSLDLPEEGS